MIPKCPMCGGKDFDRVRHIVRGGPIRYSFLGELAGRLAPTTLLSSLPMLGRACMDCGYVAMMVHDLKKLRKYVAKEDKALQKNRDEKTLHVSNEEIDENLEALEQMDAAQPTVESSDVLEDLDMTAEEEDQRRVEAMETLADGPATEATDEEGPLKDLTEAGQPEAGEEGLQT